MLTNLEKIKQLQQLWLTISHFKDISVTNMIAFCKFQGYVFNNLKNLIVTI